MFVTVVEKTKRTSNGSRSQWDFKLTDENGVKSGKSATRSPALGCVHAHQAAQSDSTRRMLHKHRKHLSGRHKKSTHQFICLLFFWVYFLPQVDGYFMSDAKAVLQGCDDHWTFQGQGHFPVLFQTTVCVDVQILSPGEWTAFSYISAPAPRYELALQGDETSLYAWLLGVRHQFPVQLTLRQWYRLCLRWDAPRKSFSLTIAGNPEVYQRTAIARAIPPSGRLLLGCQPKDASPGVKVATVELYLFRIWDDVGEHKACEDGAVVGWDSRLWDITRAQARIQDFKLQCGHLRKKRSADGKAIPPTQFGVSAVRDLRLTTPNRLVTTLASILQNILQGESPIPSSSHSTLNTTSAASPQTLTGSAGNTVPHIGGLSSSIKPISSSSYVTTQFAHSTSVNSFSMSSDFTHAAPTAITSAANPTAVIQTTTSNALFTEPFEVQCNFSQYCANESSYYWMAVEVYGSNVTEKNIQTWFSDLFSKSSCPTVNGALSSSSATFASSLGNSASVNTTSCQDGMVLLNSEVRCEDKQNIQRNNCTVLLQLNQSVSVCMLRGLVENGTGNTSIQIQLLGDVERVGKGLCVDQVMSPSGHDFVQCMSSMSYYDICQTPGPINVTCSYTERSQPVYSQCNVNSQQRCECHVSTNNETNYAVRLNIMSQKVNFTYIQNRVLQLDTPCDQSSISGSLCNSTSGVSQFYQGMHLECYGEETRLHNCILALQFSRQMDICSVSLALEVLYRNTGITFDGPLTRIAVCRLPDDSETILLNSTFKWVSSNLGASQISEMQDQLKCEQGQTLGVFLNEQCATYPETITPSKTDSPQTNKTNAVVTPTSPVVTPRNTSDPPLSSSVLTRSPNNSTVNQTNTLSLNTTNTSLPVIPTGRPSTAAFTLRTTAALENTPVIPLNTTVTPLNRTTVTPLNVTNPTATTLNRITVAPLNGTNSTVTPLNGTTVTPFNRTTPTATTLNRITVAPLNGTNSTVTPLNGTTVTPFNRTTPTATTLNRITVAPLNITNSTVTPLNGTTVTPLNRTTPSATTLNRITVAPLNTPNSTVTPLNGTTVTPLNRTTPTATTLTITNSTVTPLNGTTVTPLNRTTPTATTLNITNSTVTPLNGTTVTPLNRTTPTATTLNRITVAPLNTPNSTVTPLNGTTVTPLNRTTPTAITLNGTTVTPLNITNPTITTLNGTTTTFNRTTFAQLNRTTVTPLNRTNPTVTPLNTTATTVHVTGTNVNITITPPHVTPPPINTTITPLNTTLNATDALINTTVISHNTTTTTLNTTSLPFNATVTTPYVVATVMPFNITQLNSTTIRPLNTTQTPLNLTVTASNIVKNATQSNTTDSQHVITEFKTTAFPPNATLFNFTNPSPTTSNTTKLTTPSTTQLSTIGLGNTTRFNITSPSHYNATTLLQNSTQFSGLTTPFTPTEPVNATLLNRTTLPFTINKNTTSLNVSSFVFNTTTQFPSTTQYNLTTPLKNVTTFYTMEPSNSTAQTNITTLPVNPRDTNITQPFHNTTEFSTAYPYNITQPVNSTLNTTYDKMNTTKLTTITPQFNTTQFNTTQFNTTQFNTTQFKTTQFNTTMYTLNFTILNATSVATPVINTTQFNTSITMQFYTTIGPAMKNITSAPTVSFNSATQFNNTSEKMFTGDAAFNTTTKTNPIHTAQNKTTDSSIIEIVSNNSTASTPAVSGINTASPQNSSTSNTAAPAALQTTQATSGENTTTTTAKTVVPPGAATTSITIATTAETTTKSADAVATDLLNRTNDVSSLNSSQLNDLVNQLENLLAGPNVSLELGRTMLSVINNLLNGSASALAGSSNRLIKTVDTLGLKLVVQDKTESIAFESLTLAVTKVDGNNFVGTSFSMANPLKPQIKGGQAVRNTRAVESSSSLGQITLPASLTENLSAEEKKLASRVQFTFFQKSTFFQDKSLSQQSLNSYILGSSVANLSIKNLRENVEFTLKNTQPVAGNYVASCVFWDFNLNGGSGGWNPSGCVVKNSSTENETVCSCNHLTSFAVLLDISRQGITDRLQATILTFITYIGCGVSAIFLSITLLTYLAFDKIRRDIPSKILIHLCFGLLFLNLVFLLDSWLALYPNAVGLCISTAFFLHYFLLVSFTWMGLEALHMYLAIVKVFNNYMSRYMLKFSLAGWGVPLIVVIIVIAISKDNYGLISYGRYSDGTTDEFCWLKNDIAFYVAVVAYFGVIFLLNLAMFVVVMVHLRRIKRQNPHNSQYRSGLHDLRSIAGLTFLLGLTWGFAFFAWGPVNIAFMYLFAIFNSLQGFFIFVFHCALKENVRKQWRTYLCCGKLRLAENSEWSRTATQSNNTKKTSILTARSSLGAASIPRSSVSSDASIPSSGIGSPIDDSLIMSEEMNDDVVQNDINNLRSRFRSF